MTRVLFIGNSHLGAIKLAWEHAAPKGYEVEFFGAPQRAWMRMAHLPDNQYGVPASGDYKRHRDIIEQANGKPAVSLANRDIVIMVGAFSAAEPIAAVLAECDVPDLRETGAATLLTEPLFAKACATLATDCLPFSGWLNRSDFKLAAMPRPAPADSVLTSTYPPYQPWHVLAANPAGMSDAAALFDAALGAVMAANGVTYIPQPAETLTAIGLTPARFLAAGGGNKPGEAHKRGDHAHMDTAFGAACVAQTLTWLSSQI
jgi:hypothetical protein